MQVSYRPYMHVERLGTDEVDGILNGCCCISTKLDGTNTVIWMDDGNVCVGSRKRVITPEDDNAGCAAYVLSQPEFRNYLEHFPSHILYGEFLVQHSIKTYVPTAWKKVYIFDVYDVEKHQYLDYEDYIDGLNEYNILSIPPIDIINNPTQEDIEKCIKHSTFLNNGEPGEGIVIHNPSFKNKWGRTVFAKIVRDEFKTVKKEGKRQSNTTLEEDIVERFCTPEFIEKEYHKLVEDAGGWETRYIGRLLSTIWYTFINEESWHIIKKFKNPTINYRLLNLLVIQKIKEVKRELF